MLIKDIKRQLNKIEITVADSKQAEDVMRSLPEIAEGKEYDITITEHRKRRSIDANGYYWTLAGKIAAVMRTPKEQIYREHIKNIGDNYTVVCAQTKAAGDLIRHWAAHGIGWIADTTGSKISGCTNVLLYYGSSAYDTKQMSRLIDNAVEDCKAVGIETLPPDELEHLKSEWR